MPRRRRSLVAVDAKADMDVERSFAMRMLLRSPKDMVAGTAAFVAVGAIVANAMFMQAGHHPSPMFGSGAAVPLVASMAVNPLPRPRPVEADARLSEVRPVDQRAMEAKPAESRVADPVVSRIKATPVAPPALAAHVPRPPAPIPVSSRSDPLGDLIISSRRVAAIQRSLTEYGYGQLKTTGTVGSDTQAAIQKFKRDRKIPVTGQMSDRLVSELAAMTGRPIE